VNVASLPYAVLILLVELAVGSLAVLTVFDARRQVTAGYVKAGAITILPTAILAMATFVSLGQVQEVDGYRLQSGWLQPFGVVFGVFTVLAGAHFVVSMMERREAAVRVGALGSVVGAVSLVLLAGLLAAPAWSFAGMLLSIFASASVLGGALMAMMWGHWYLTSGRLPKEPMEQMSLVVLAALVAQGVIVLLGAALPVREAPLSEGFGLALIENPAFWLRIVVGIAFPIVLAVLAWRAAQIRGMMSATGLLYIALGAVLAGEVLARGLLFSTGQTV
jgi:hypothetical protein